MANEQTQSALDVDGLLDGTLDDLADAPSFEPFNAGAHHVVIDWEGPIKVGTHPAIKLKMKLIETKELSDSNAIAQAAGSEAEQAFMLDNEYGQGGLKILLNSLAQTYKGTNREIMQQSKGAECLVITEIRTNKDKTAKYTNVKEISVI